MLVDLQNVPEDGMAIERGLVPAELARERGLRLPRPATLRARLTPSDDETYRLRGKLRAGVELDCVRCLEPLELSVDESLDLLYLPQSDNIALGGEDDRGLERDELIVSFYRDDVIDLGHMVWEQIVLALPMKPLCRDDCRGLCPQCGVDRNRASCACVEDTLDPRWQSLRSLVAREPGRTQKT